MNEVVLFRTHAEILTDHRIIMRGESYPLARVERAYVRPAWYYAPFLLVRLLIVLAATLLILSYLGVVDPNLMPGGRSFHLLGGVMGVVMVALLTWLVPTHSLWIRTQDGERRLVLRSTHAGHLRDVRAQIETAMRARQDVSRPAMQTAGYAAEMGVSR
ncbi:MAG: hypothetical protein EHM39_09190 [Chloroflexi bacterium]|nr:MAG: hypothetical protein EHM39_09190 [Chloroflexota bacterium]